MIDNEAVFRASPVTGRKARDLFSGEEIRALTERSDLMGAWAIVSTWSLIGATFVLMVFAARLPWWGALPLLAIGLAVLGSRQLALAVLVHEATHGTLFRTRRLNDRLTSWLCSAPIGLDLHKYRAHHFVHHTHAGTDQDSDVSLVAGLPTSRSSLARKLARDLAGITGLKLLLAQVLMAAGVLRWTVASDVERLPANGRRWPDYARAALKNLAPMLAANAALLGLLAAAGQAWLYAMWVLAYLVPYPLFTRIRALAEHACMERTRDMFLNTRSTRAGWLARATVAPLNVNYHVEHHVMASVPYFRLPRMHRLLRERGALAETPGYLDVLRIVSAAPA